MARTKFWTRGIVDTLVGADFQQIQLTTNLAGDTLLRVHFQAWLEVGQVVPSSGQPLKAAMIFLGFYDGPWATWQSAHPSVPAESTYGWLHYERHQWGLVEHTIDTTKYDQLFAPLGNVDRDVKSQRIVKANGDGLVLMGYLNPVGSSINPFAMNLHGAYEALWESP